MQPTIPNTRDFEIMLKIIPTDGIGLSCVCIVCIGNVTHISNALIGIE
jgi:hypothetical protein